MKQQIVFLQTPESDVECNGIRCTECYLAQRFISEYYLCFNRDKLMHSMMDTVLSQKLSVNRKKHIALAS